MEIKSDGQSDGIQVDDRNELYKYFINVIIYSANLDLKILDSQNLFTS
jgi:hypothetical protein